MTPIPLGGLVARASTLRERMAGAVDLVPGDPDIAARRLSRWSEQVARGDERRFAARLALDGLDRERALLVVGEAVRHRTDALPDWARFVEEGLARAGRADLDDDPCLPAPGEDPVPLQELTVPFVQAARERLTTRIARDPSLVEPEVLNELEQQLLRQLGSLVSPVAHLAFRAWRRRRLHGFDEALERALGNPGRALYDEWVSGLRAGGLGELLSEYAVLARKVGTLALGWVDATAEFLERLARDGRLVAEMFAGGRPLGPLIRLGGAFSDPHRGRRRVVGCTFACGLRLVYKPKSLRSEVVYGRLADWLNEHGAAPPLRALSVLDCGDHGWVELAENVDVPDIESARRYYRRAGMLLALLYGIGGNDCHSENLVAAGEHPLVVDSETVLHPALLPPDAPVGEELDALHLAVDRYAGSVLGIGLLPDWTVGPDGRAFDVSGLGAIEPQVGLDPVPQWEHPNSDVARLVSRETIVEPLANVLRVAGRAQRPEAYVDEICSGFREAYAILADRRDELLAPDGLLAALRDAPVRVIFRGTQLYARVVNVAHVPDHLRFGVDQSIELEALARPLVDGPDPDVFWELHRREQRDLEATDTPYFAVPGGAEGLLDGNGRALVRFRASALASARRRLESLGDEDRDLQLALLRAALSTRFSPVAQASREPASGADAAEEAAPGRALQAARLLGEELEATAISSGGGAAWVGLSLGDEAERWVLRPTAYDLYQGAVGIAVFLAALARVDNDERWRDLCLRALAPTLEEAERHPGRLAVLRGVGGSSGSGGTIYGLVLVARLLGEDRPLDAARRIASGLTAAAFGQDETLDLMSGTAGALSALLALDRTDGDDRGALELAALAGRRLAAAAVELDEGGIGWKTIRGRALDGFSHGTAGLALALARLLARTGDEELLPVVRGGLRAESGRYDAALGGWPDRREDEGGRHALTNWCHGAAGIGLSRLGLLELPLPADVHELARRDLERAASAVRARGSLLDHLCCGGAGESEFLFELAGATGDDEVSTAASRRCDELAERILAGEAPRLNRPEAAGRAVPSPGLFQGTAGVGLVLLRRCDPALPSVLSWG
jgi:type 2 lantibiotic biosynthesis protein LanM